MFIIYYMLLSLAFFVTTVSADYETVSVVVGPFNNETRVQCFDVNIIDDPDPEGDEDFFIGFDATVDAVNILPLHVSITIKDNDCMLTDTLYIYLICTHIAHIYIVLVLMHCINVRSLHYSFGNRIRRCNIVYC